MDGELWQVGTLEGKGIPRNIKIEKHCMLVKHTVTGSRQMIRTKLATSGLTIGTVILRIEHMWQMTSNSCDYRLEDTSKEHNVEV